MIRTTITRSLTGSLVAAVALSAAGCQLPDLRPFAESTAAVHAGVDRSGAVFLESAARVLDENDTTEAAHLKTLEESWKKRRKASAALAEYAASLAAIAEVAGNHKGVDDFLDSVESLMQTAGASGLAGSAVLRSGGTVYQLFKQAASLKTLAGAVERADPVVEKVCKILIDDLKTALPPLDSAEQKALVELETSSHKVDRNLVKGVLVQRKSILGSVCNPDGTLKAGVTADQFEQAVERLKLLDVSLEAAQARVARTEREMNDVKDEYEGHRTLVEQTIGALESVRSHHRNLRMAIELKGTLSAANVTYAAGQVKSTIERIEELRRRDE